MDIKILEDKKTQLCVCIVGVDGKMGRQLQKVILASKNMSFSCGISKVTDLKIAESELRNSNIFIDFSSPDGMLTSLKLAKKMGIAFLSGTTGLSPEHHDELEKASKFIPVLWSSNFSMSASLLVRFVGQVSAVLQDFEAQITDIHHLYKKDSPSGTAISIVNQIRKYSSIEPEVFSIKRADTVAEYAVRFACQDELLEVKYVAKSRNVFSIGALECASWLLTKPAGLYTMDDFLDGNFLYKLSS